MDIAEIPEMKVGLNAMNYMFVSGKGAVLGEEVEVDETGEQRTVTSTPTMVDIPEDAVGFAEGGEVTPEKPVENHKMNPPIRFNPQVQMVPVANPTDQQQPPQQPEQPQQAQNPQQAPNKMDYSQAFPFDTTGGMIAEKNKPQPQPQPQQQPPPPRQPPPRQNPMQQGIGALR